MRQRVGSAPAGSGIPPVGAVPAAAPVRQAAAGQQNGRRGRPPAQAAPSGRAPPAVVPQPSSGLAPDDPLAAFLLKQAHAVDITALDLASPALAALRDAGVVLVVPLISSGSLIGLLNLGPRLSERGYSSQDRRVLDLLASYAAPAVRVGQLVREQQAEARARERIDQELRLARHIQQQFLPPSVPALPGWRFAACYRPARSVGGDFYDFIPLPDGRMMFVIGDVTDKGIPAALVMASTHALLRDAAPRLGSPGRVLAQVNDQLFTDIPAHMFVTCFAMILDPSTGWAEFANAGQDVPYVRTANGVAELRARGMPLGLMAGSGYEEKRYRFRAGDCALLHSDGLAEARAPDKEMFGFPRVASIVAAAPSGEELIESCLASLAAFTGPGSEQEDDMTLVTLQRTAGRTGRSRP